MKQFFFICFLLGISPCLSAVDNLRLPDIRCMGMGMCGVTNSSLFNPALVSRENSKSVDINYFNYYGLKELGTVNVAFSYPNDFLSAGVDISSFGYDQYRYQFAVYTSADKTDGGKSSVLVHRCRYPVYSG